MPYYFLMVTLGTLIIPARNESTSLRKIIPFIPLLSKRITEIVIVVDFPEDSTLQLRDEFLDFSIKITFVVTNQTGVPSALNAGVDSSTNDYLVICMADELLPLLEIDQFLCELDNGARLVSATRYKKNARRFGGSKIGHFLSKLVNKILAVYYRNKVSDVTTGMKAFHKKDWVVLGEKIGYGGWASAIAITKNALKNNLTIKEVPIVSVDRLFGGVSTFKLGTWIKEYLKALFA